MFVYLFTCCWTFGLFPGLDIMNKAAINTFVHVFLWTYVFVSLGKSLRAAGVSLLSEKLPHLFPK